MLLMVVVSRTYHPPSGQEPPKVTDWMQGWSSVVGVIAGLGAAILTAGLLLHEVRQAAIARREAVEARAEATRERAEAAADRARIEQERLDAMKAPARAVFTSGLGFSGRVDFGYLSNLNVTVSNYGPGHIHRVAVKVVSARDEASLNLIQVIGPGGQAASASKHFHPDALLPGIAAKDGTRIEVRFIDVNGRSWIRVDNGEPEECPDPW
ncbi:hypothetical protein [Micromonospora sp. C41]|uniref:hypothetical protein n=1 Tax=Micromonospora sp. C41 TaxID=2824878 RepID=UPI001B36AF83|nr:hypothetical protein [Micromonospora sp. C41]MBQ1061374.1 hypothetical protein [Micromonospora sp. C41]